MEEAAAAAGAVLIRGVEFVVVMERCCGSTKTKNKKKTITIKIKKSKIKTNVAIKKEEEK